MRGKFGQTPVIHSVESAKKHEFILGQLQFCHDLNREQRARKPESDVAKRKKQTLKRGNC